MLTGVKCPTCRGTLQVDDELAPVTMRCPMCGATFHRLAATPVGRSGHSASRRKALGAALRLAAFLFWLASFAALMVAAKRLCLGELPAFVGVIVFAASLLAAAPVGWLLEKWRERLDADR